MLPQVEDLFWGVSHLSNGLIDLILAVSGLATALARLTNIRTGRLTFGLQV